MLNKKNSIFEETKRKLSNAGYKLTPQRIVTLETIIDNQADLMTAEEIFIAVKEKNPTIGLATVYRTLDMLHQLEVVKKIPFRDGMSRYDLIRSADEYQPSYLLCLECGKIIEINDPIIEPTKQQVENSYQFKIATYQLTFHGICEECIEREAIESESS